MSPLSIVVADHQGAHDHVPDLVTEGGEVETVAAGNMHLSISPLPNALMANI